MGFMEAVNSVFRRYVDFQGRSSRSEFWWWYLAYIIVYLVIDVLVLATHNALVSLLFLVFVLGVFLPTLAVAIRRLHDTDRSGWWILIGLIPLIGAIVLIVFYCMPGTPGDNKFGSNPLGAAA